MELKSKLRITLDKLLNLRIDQDTAIEEILQAVEKVYEIGAPMGETERKYFMGIIKEHYKAYDYSTRGETENMRAFLNGAINLCGWEKLEVIPNTKENRTAIEMKLYDIRSKYL